jgi:hypothetical protein
MASTKPPQRACRHAKSPDVILESDALDNVRVRGARMEQRAAQGLEERIDLEASGAMFRDLARPTGNDVLVALATAVQRSEFEPGVSLLWNSGYGAPGARCASSACMAASSCGISLRCGCTSTWAKPSIRNSCTCSAGNAAASATLSV